MNNSNISSSKYLKSSPFNEYNKFAITYEEGAGEDISKVTFGSFSQSDIAKFDLTPFKTEYNSDLSISQGYIADTLIKRELSSFSKSSYRSILAETESLIEKFKI